MARTSQGRRSRPATPYIFNEIAKNEPSRNTTRAVERCYAQLVFTLANRVGKLCELRYLPPFTDEDSARLLPQMGLVVDQAKGPLIFCTDLRPMRGFSQTLLDSIIWRLRRNNPKVRAAGSIVSNPHVFRLMERVAAEAHNPMRRVFSNLGDLRAHLDPFLSAAERDRRDAFLDEFGVAPALVPGPA